jgi:hypothetical protein
VSELSYCSRCGHEWLTPGYPDGEGAYIGPCCRGDVIQPARKAGRNRAIGGLFYSLPRQRREAVHPLSERTA